MDDIARHDLLKKINNKLGWIVVLLVLIMLNTCSLGDNLSDAARDLRGGAAPDAPASPAVPNEG